MEVKKTILLVGLAVSLAVVTSIADAQPPESCLGSQANDVRSTDNDDFLTGTDEVDIVALGLGDDQYFSFTGPDLLCGNEGADVLGGEAGADEINGGPGDDILAGLGGQDLIIGGTGTDVIKGHGGDDELRAVAEDGDQDHIYDGPGSDIIVGHDEDIWHRCDDGESDPHDNFTGIIIPDPDCEV